MAGFKTMRLIIRSVAALASVGVVSGCGTFVPHMEEPWEHGTAAAYEKDIQAHVFCEFARAVIDAGKQAKYPHYKDGNDPGEQLDPGDDDIEPVPDNWQASLGLILEVDEETSFNPGVSLITPLPAGQQYATTLGAQLQAQTLHTDTFDFHYDLNQIKAMTEEDFGDACVDHPNSSLLSSGHPLRIQNWLHSALAMAHRHPEFGKLTSASTPNPNYKPNLLQYETKFIVTSTGSVTPQWKLTRVLTNQSAVVPPAVPFLSANRVRTNDLIITMGPAGTGVTTVAASLGVGAGAAPSLTGAPLRAGAAAAPRPVRTRALSFTIPNQELLQFHLNALSSAQTANQISSQLNGIAR